MKQEKPLFGFADQPTHYTLADGRAVPAGEIVAAAVQLRAEREPQAAELTDWNDLTDGLRAWWCDATVEAMNQDMAAGAANVDAANVLDSLAPQAQRLLGDALIDAALTEVKALARPWQQMTEDQQSDVLERITSQVKAAVADTIRLLATRGTKNITCELESVTLKKGAKATLIIPKGEVDEDLVDAVGQTVILVVGAMDPVGEIVQPAPDPLQKPLPLAADDSGLATHSDPED